jgi:hypothetical protein
MTGAKTTTASVFTYAYETKLQIGSTAPATILTDAQVPDLDGYFFEKPINVEVRDAILDKCSAANTWLWSQFDMNIAAGNASGSSVTISAKTGSLYYTGTRTITFQYKS